MYFPCLGGLLYKTCSYKFCKIHIRYLSERLSFSISCGNSAYNYIKKETSVNLTKFLRTSLQNTFVRLPLCFVSFSEILIKKLYLFIYLFIPLFFIYSWLTANEITVYNKITMYIYMLIDVNFQTLKNWKIVN